MSFHLPRFLVLLLAAWISSVALGQRPNIVFIISDDHGTDDIGAYGHPNIHTPALDALAVDGVRFTQAYATAASCTPSRATLQTGLHNHANGLYGLSHATHHFRAHEPVQSLSALLSDLGGYATARVGKFHVAPTSLFPFDHEIEAQGNHPVLMARATRDFIETQVEIERPFFLYYATHEPHRSRDDRTDLPHAPNYFHNDKADVAGIDRFRVAPEDVVVPPYLPDTPASRAELVEYYEAVARMDAGIGEVIDILKDTGIYEDTLILYLTDNGIAFPGAKTTLYQPGIRLPLIVKLPGEQEGGLVSDAMVSWVDITPTLLDFAGVLDLARERLARIFKEEYRGWDNIAMPDFHGRSLRLVLADPNVTAGWDEVYASHNFHEVTMYYPMRSIITRDYKLIWNIAHALEYPVAADLWRSPTWQYSLEAGGQMGMRSFEALQHRPEFELYDIRNDPWEAHNLAADPAHAETLATLQTKLRAFQEATADPWLLKWDRE